MRDRKAIHTRQTDKCQPVHYRKQHSAVTVPRDLGLVQHKEAFLLGIQSGRKAHHFYW